MITAKTQRKLEADDSAGIIHTMDDDGPFIDEIPKGVDYKKLFADEAFMAEQVLILLHPTQDMSEIEVPVSVNGKRVPIIPNRPTRIPRTHVAQLLKARPDVVNHRSDNPQENERYMNRMYRQSTSRYNFDVLEDTSRGVMWLRELRANYTQR